MLQQWVLDLAQVPQQLGGGVSVFPKVDTDCHFADAQQLHCAGDLREQLDHVVLQPHVDAHGLPALQECSDCACGAFSRALRQADVAVDDDRHGDVRECLLE
eukprot:2562366-Rhodomonas_salina.1